jgi:anti-sigma B factor antagonist
VTEDVFEFETEERDGSATVRLRGELDLAEVATLQAELDRLCSNGLSALTVDLSGLDFVDSTGLHALLRLRGRCESQQVSLQLVPGPPAVQRLFRLTGTDVQFTFLEPPPAPAP